MILLKSGLLFWLGGGLAYLYHIDGFPMLAHLQDWLTTEKMHPLQTLLTIFALLIGLTAVASEFLLVPTRRVETKKITLCALASWSRGFSRWRPGTALN